MNINLSKLNRVNLRDVWGHEAIDFTSWLAQQENLDALSEEIGVDIKLIKTEANVGKFSVDVLAEEEASGRKIIIENQLEDTNHDHLGKIITYASGYDAEIIIWIVKDVRDEHQKAIEWLNEHTDEDINFFLIKIELWQIEGSNPAPKFEIMVSPNEWAKAIKTSPTSGELTDTKLQQLEFWNKLKNYIRERDTQIRLQTPRPQHWYDVSMGSSDGHVTLTINSRDNLIGCEIYINRNKDLFNFLRERNVDIENEVGESIEWVDAATASRIKIRKKVADVFDQGEAEPYFAWLYEKTVLFQKVFTNEFNEFKKQ
ncbi:DUF4268 domain-containing protein [candidate division WWE3 bacterium CG_4_9_14_3_um_filter_41_6]|uniref:DUF4268 domain-containing protein n=1 Tax=candidate division WWE3 bacterium CG_4_10_14_0_2_um_filter_41_14 TaxID=1975072 RepID=A0A2M7TI11_UNCKA|nr:MAG: DUF4268 domain-containing protein [candidate division WWE3 bacterium CG_4_10_14_0_2_um_filter_41_14]PJA39444.1 MAG: DUF4268 domain-containing protein [candidate division WWE3 bacterium CG_4_9_14_3_um_filter_41_6]